MDVDAVVEAIESGHFDGQLTGIAEALRERNRSQMVEMCWRVTFEGMTVTEEDLTIAELDAIEQTLSTPARPFFYPQLAPTISAQHASAVLMTCLIHRKKYDVKKAHEALKKTTMRNLLEMFSEYEVERPPKGGTEPGS